LGAGRDDDAFDVVAAPLSAGDGDVVGGVPGRGAASAAVVEPRLPRRESRGKIARRRPAACRAHGNSPRSLLRRFDDEVRVP
jgi:hypothetical protein